MRCRWCWSPSSTASRAFHQRLRKVRPVGRRQGATAWLAVAPLPWVVLCLQAGSWAWCCGRSGGWVAGHGWCLLDGCLGGRWGGGDDRQALAGSLAGGRPAAGTMRFARWAWQKASISSLLLALLPVRGGCVWPGGRQGKPGLGAGCVGQVAHVHFPARACECLRVW